MTIAKLNDSDSEQTLLMNVWLSAYIQQQYSDTARIYANAAVNDFKETFLLTENKELK